MSSPGSHDDAPATPAERAEAESFARLIDRLVSDEELPPVMASEERVLIEVAAVVRACTGEPRLDESRQRALIDDALSPGPRLSVTAADTGRHHDLEAPEAPEAAQAVQAVHDREPPGRTEPRSTRRRERFQRALPWAVAAVSAAAALLLALRSPGPTPAPTQAPESPRDLGSPRAERLHLQPIHRSRSADSLIGEIPRPRSAAASDRIDVIFADRLMGYRDLRLRGGRP